VAEHHFLRLVYRMPAKPPTGRVAPNADEAQTWLRRCESLLEEFEAKVFELHDGDERSRFAGERGASACASGLGSKGARVNTNRRRES
jgi:hypothetical protein